MKTPPHTITCKDIEGNTYQVPANELAFRPAVYAVIIKDGQILMSKQWDGYDFPGGGIELGEPTESALIREVKEETGVDVVVNNIIQCQDSFFKLPFSGTFVHSIHLYYQCQIMGGELSAEFLNEQEKQYAGEPEWLELNKIKNVKIYTSADVDKLLESFYSENLEQTGRAASPLGRDTRRSETR